MDLIEHLQTDESDVSDKDIYLINSIFTHKKTQNSYNIKKVIVASLLFIILSLPRLDELIETTTKKIMDYIDFAIF